MQLTNQSNNQIFVYWQEG